MDSKLAQKYKTDNHYSNINHAYNMFKGNLMLFTDMKVRWNNKCFPSRNVIIVKSSPYESTGILRYDHYHSDSKLGLGIVEIRRITCLHNNIIYFMGFKKQKSF